MLYALRIDLLFPSAILTRMILLKSLAWFMCKVDLVFKLNNGPLGLNNTAMFKLVINYKVVFPLTVFFTFRSLDAISTLSTSRNGR